MTVGRGKTFGDTETIALLKIVRETPFHMHKRGRYAQASWYGEDKVLQSFGEYLTWYLKEMTYPYGKPISQIWSHLYKAPTTIFDETSDPNYVWTKGVNTFMGMHQDKEVPGGFRKTDTTGVQEKTTEYFMGMHQVKCVGKGKDPLKFYSTTLVIEKSDDLEGGEIILAGDSYEDYEVFQSRLKVVNLKVGETAIWNGETVHGIGEITKGHRWALVTFKDVN